MVYCCIKLYYIKPSQPTYRLNILIKIVLLFITIGVSSYVSLFGQDQIKGTLNYVNYSIKDGLPSNETYDVFQDSKGFIWIGTDNGVVKYDGTTFQTFTTLDGLTDNTIFKIKEDHQGRIWFMTYNKMLCFYQNGRFSPFIFNEELNKALSKIRIGETISDFYMDSNQTVHIFLANFTHVSITNEGKTNVNIMIKGPPSSIYHFPETQLENLYQNLIPYLKKAPNHHKFYVQTNKWGTLHLFTADTVNYIGTSTGLKTINLQTGFITNSVLEGYYITGIETDFEGGFWCSTLKNGVMYIPNPHILFFNTLNNQNMDIQGIVPQNDLLIYSMSSRVNNNWVLDTLNNYLSPYPSELDGYKIPASKRLSGIKFENPTLFKNIAFLTLSILSIEGVPYYFSSYSIRVIDSLKKSDLLKIDFSEYVTINDTYEEWYQDSSDRALYKKSSPHIINRPIALYPIQTKVLKALLTSTGEVILGTTNGLYRFNINANTIKREERFPLLSELRIQDIIETKDQSLIFATKANGIYIYNDSITTNYSMNSGLLSNTVNQLAYDSISNTIWAATNNGLSKLSQQENNEWVAESIVTKFDGLKSHDIRSMYFYHNYLSFTNHTGVNLISSNYLSPSSARPFLYPKEYLVNNISKDSSSILSLPHDSNNISISFQAISYKSSQSVFYEYQLLPNDTLWQKSKSNQINFNTLPPGEYTLNVKATNYYGISSKTKTVHFSIIPAFWMTTWFYLIIVILSLAIGYYISSRSIQIYKNQAKFQRSMKEMHVISLQSKMNPHFIFNSLNSIQNYILKNEKLKANEYLLEFSSLIRSILQNSEQTTITLKKELETLKMYVNLEKKRIRQEFIYTEHIHSTINIDKCLIPTLLIQPYIENAIWHGKVHTNPNGKIAIHVTREDQTLSFEITDNGIGIEQAEKLKIRSKKHKSIGSETTKKRIQLLSELNNEITEVKFSNLDSDLKDFPGTRITFTIPYKESDLPNRF